jgi:putative tricarboxylic transport membrane protein
MPDSIPTSLADRMPRDASAPASHTLPRAVSARRGGIAVAAVLAAVGLVFAWQALMIEFGDLGLPGPGFFPLWLGAAVLFLSVVTGGRLLLTLSEAEPVWLGHRDVLIVLAALVAVPLLFEQLGAYLTLGLFGAVLLVLLARTSIVVALMSAAVAMAACWYFFQVLLGLSLPMGPLGYW